MSLLDEKNVYYLGNQKLKKVNVPVNFTKKQIIEFGKCANDPIYFIKKYVKIVNPNKGLTGFGLWPFQERMVETFIENRFTVCKIPRQSGKTQTVVAVLLWYVLFHQNYTIAVLAHKASQSREILSRLQFSYEHLPKWLQQGIVEWSKGTVILENGSKIETSATSGNSVRGKTYNCVYLDEFAFVPNNIQTEFYATVMPTISAGETTKMIITSTPNGMNMFHKIWNESVSGENSFKNIGVHWSEIPGRDEKWQEETIKNSSVLQFNQEFGCEFLGSQNTLISAAKLEQIASLRPIRQNEDMKIYIDPSKKEHRDKLYIMVVDTSRGVGGDYNAFVIFDVSSIPYKIVGQYKNNTISPLIFPNIIHQFAKSFNNAYICVEINDNGQQVADILYREMEYENMVFSHMRGNMGQQLSSGFGSRPTVGIRTTKLVKRIGCTNFKTLVETDKLLIQDDDIKKELYNFIEINESFAAAEGHHDDLVMCCVLFSWLVQQPYFKDWTDTNVRERMVADNLKLLDDDVLPIYVEDDSILYGGDEIRDVSYNEYLKFIMED